MSYILDALRKSDEERQRGTVPGVPSLQASTGPGRKPRRKWPLLLLALLLVNGGLLAWWWLSPVSREAVSVMEPQAIPTPPEGGRLRRNLAPQGKTLQATAEPSAPEAGRVSARGEDPKDTGNPPQRAPQMDRAPSAEAPAATRSGRARAELARRNVGRPSPQAATSEPSARVQRPVSQAASNAPQEDSSAKVLGEMESTAAGTIGKGAGMPDGAVQPVEPSNAARSTGTPMAAGSPVTPRSTQARDREAKSSRDIGRMPPKAPREDNAPLETARVPAPAAGKLEGKVPELRELSPALQREVPSLSFSMLIHSKVPGERMITINGKVMREGDEVAPGLKLEEILTGGAVFTFKGQRFRKGFF